MAEYGSIFEIYEIANRANYSIGELTLVSLPSGSPTLTTTAATNLTVAEMIQNALEAITVHDPGEALNAEDGGTGLRVLNLLFDELSLDRGKIFQLTEETFVLVAGTGIYSIGPGMTWNTVVPTDIIQAFLRDTSVTPNYDWPLRVNVTQAEYNAIPYKSMSNRPFGIFYAPGSAVSRAVYFDYLPDLAYDLHLFSLKPFTAIGAITDSLSMPPGYQAYLTAALAVRLAPLYKKQVPAVFAAIEAKMERSIDAQNASTPPTWQDKSVPRLMNWSRGGFR
jgi:hypothetical protein